jgi:hypothetical protein
MPRERLYLHNEPPYMRPYPPANAARQSRRRVHVINDEITEPFQGLGQVQTSKSRWRAEVKARGYEELGNERAEATREPEFQGVDVRPTIAEVMNG